MVAGKKLKSEFKYIVFEFSVTSNEQKEILTALLNNYGFEGLEELADSLRAYIAQERFHPEAFKTYLRQFPSIEGIPFIRKVLASKNWNEAWEKSYEPVTIADKVRIRASFHKPVKNFDFDLLIDPKMSFGTGHHETTQLMIEMMLDMDFRQKRILDFGSGTGVLSILAHKMKAKSVIAIDIDEWAFENIRENIKINRAKNIEPSLGGADAIGAEKFDVILANVNKNIISENMELLVCALIRGGMILFSGLLENDEYGIVKSARNNGLILKEKKTKNGWLCLKFAKR
jgi:ribosomal protein L11 methyltransferase